MPKYRIVLRKPDGTEQTGSVTAPDEGAIAWIVANNGLSLVRVIGAVSEPQPDSTNAQQPPDTPPVPATSVGNQRSANRRRRNLILAVAVTAIVVAALTSAAWAGKGRSKTLEAQEGTPSRETSEPRVLSAKDCAEIYKSTADGLDSICLYTLVGQIFKIQSDGIVITGGIYPLSESAKKGGPWPNTMAIHVANGPSVKPLATINRQVVWPPVVGWIVGDCGNRDNGVNGNYWNCVYVGPEKLKGIRGLISKFRDEHRRYSSLNTLLSEDQIDAVMVDFQAANDLVKFK